MIFPLMVRADRLRALVVGGGQVAHRKTADLLAAGVEVEVISPKCSPELEELLSARGVLHHRRGFRPGDTAGFGLVVVATDDASLNRSISEEAERAGIPVNVVDRPELCTVYFPAVVRRKNLLLAISTGGGAPFFARELRKRLETWVDEGWSDRARWAVSLRSYALREVPDPAQRELLFARLMDAAPEEIAGRERAGGLENLWARWWKETKENAD